jgi:Secretion system C-terminal sorting domain
LNTGVDWANAFTSLESALQAARTCGVTEIWVAKGTYVPSAFPQNITGSPTLTSRDYTFHLVDGVKMYGGFVGTETTITDRVVGNETILSGDLLGDDGIEEYNVKKVDNTYHVVISISDNLNTLIDGLTIKAGNAFSTLNSYLTIEGINIDRNAGGGIYNSSSFLNINNNVISNNRATMGGGIFNYYSQINLKRSFIVSNVGIGPAIYNNSSNIDVSNSIFHYNLYQNQDIFITGSFASYSNGAFHNNNSSPIILNCTFAGNSRTMKNQNNSNPIITNSIIWDTGVGYAGLESAINNYTGSNPVISFCTSKIFLLPGIGNNTNDPFFLDNNDFSFSGAYTLKIGTDGIWNTIDDGLRLKSTSPAINASDPTTTSPSTDISNYTRNGIFDIGAYEYNLCQETFTSHRAFVNYAATGANTGTSWADAFTNLESALQAARTCGVTEIWVAKGTYVPSAFPQSTVTTSLTNRDFTFHLVDGVKMYGGFVGTETAISARVPSNITTLSGDILGNDLKGYTNNIENCYHVVLSVNDTPATLIDGFTITGGYANIIGPDGEVSYNVIEGKNIFSYNGGGMNNNTSMPTISKVNFFKNYAGIGGAIDNTTSSPKILNSVFRNNLTSAKAGGMNNNSNSNPNIINCLFYGNVAEQAGAMQNTQSSPIITNCDFYKNSATNLENGIVNTTNSNPVITNSILWDSQAILNFAANKNSKITETMVSTPVITYSIVNGASVYPGIGNSNADPLFVSATLLVGTDGIWGTADDGLALQTSSPAMNTGTNSVVTASTDIAGATRIQNTTVDMGAFEVAFSAPLPVKLISFEAKANENNVNLTWATSSETNSAGFEIERSGNGQEFNKIGFVKSDANIGNSKEKLSYNFMDASATLSNQIYYRLKQIDLDGKFEYSQIKSVKLIGEVTIKVYPNPVTDFLTIDVGDFSKIKTIELLDAKGSSIYKRNSGENKIDMNQNSPGIYFLKIENINGKVEVRKVLKN